MDALFGAIASRDLSLDRALSDLVSVSQKRLNGRARPIDVGTAIEYEVDRTVHLVVAHRPDMQVMKVGDAAHAGDGGANLAELEAARNAF